MDSYGAVIRLWDHAEQRTFPLPAGPAVESTCTTSIEEVLQVNLPPDEQSALVKSGAALREIIEKLERPAPPSFSTAVG